MVRESEEVEVKRDTLSYFWLLIPVIVKVSSKSNGSDIVAVFRCITKLMRLRKQQ